MLFDELRRYMLLPSGKNEEEIKEEIRRMFPYEEFKKIAEAKGLDGSEEAYEKFLEEATRFKKDPFRFQENVGFSAHFEDIPFLLHKELIVRQREGKEPVFGCRVRIEERGYEEEREGERVFIPYGDSKKWVEVLEVLSGEEISRIEREEKCERLAEVVRVVEEKAGERVSDIQVKELVLHMAMPRMCKALCLENRLFIMCERDEELVATLEFLTSPPFGKDNEEKEVAWEMILIARPEGYIVRLEDVKKLPVVEF